MGRTLVDRGRVREGFLWPHAIARLLPQSANAMVSVGLANERMADVARATVWYERAVAQDSMNTRAYARLEHLWAMSRR